MKTFFICMLISFSACELSHATTTDNWKTASKADVLGSYQKAMDWFVKTGNYKVTIGYASFKDHTSAAAFDQSSGYYIRSGKNVHSHSFGVHTIQNQNIRFAVDTVNKMIILNNTTEVGQALLNTDSFSDLLDHVKTAQTQQLENGNSIYKIELRPNELYSAFEFEINAKGMLTKLKYFYSRELTEESDEETNSEIPVKKDAFKSKPRLEVTFSNYQTGLIPDYEKEFSEKKYFKTEGKKIILSEKYKRYTLKDYRFNAKK